MKTADQLITAALKTQDPAQLYQLLEDAVDTIRRTEAQLAFSKNREQQLSAQVLRQTAMIDNLEKTLWGKK